MKSDVLPASLYLMLRFQNAWGQGKQCMGRLTTNTRAATVTQITASPPALSSLLHASQISREDSKTVDSGKTVAKAGGVA